MIPLLLVPLVLLWDFDRTAVPTSFLVLVESVAGITGGQKLLVAGVASGACATLTTGDAEAFCVTMACPGPGIFRVTVEAIRYQTRSETITLRVLDSTCTQVEGASQGSGSLADVPSAAHCRPPTTVPTPPVQVTVPSTIAYSVPIPTPHAVAPVIPVNPEVIPKTPHMPGTVALPTLTVPAQIPTPPSETPATLTVSLPAGPPTTLTVPQPAVTRPGVPCP
jgi:hypothetical protein